VVLVGGSLLSGLYWITQRREAVARAEGSIAIPVPRFKRNGNANQNDKERS